MADKRESIDFTKSLMETMGKVGGVDKRKIAASEEEVSMGSKPDSYYTGGEIMDTDDGAPMSTEAPISVEDPPKIPVAKLEDLNEDPGIFELPPPVESETVSVETPEHQVSSKDGKEQMKNFLIAGQQLARGRKGEKVVQSVLEEKSDENILSSRERRMALLKKIVPKSKVVTESSTNPPEKKWKSIVDRAVSEIGASSD